MSAAEVIRFGAPLEAEDSSYLLLADGGLLVGDVRADAETIVAESLLFGKVELPLERVAAVVFRPPAGRSDRDRFDQRLFHSDHDDDRLILDNDDAVDGTLSRLAGDAVEIEGRFGAARVELDRVVAMTFNSTVIDRSLPKGLCSWVGFVDGSRLIVESMTIDGEQAEITWREGVTLQTAAANVVFLQPLGGQAVYLSRLEPHSYKHIPFFAMPWSYVVGANVDGARLRAGERLYVEGIGMHSASRLTFDLDRPYRRFEARVAIDDQVAPRGSVVFRIFADTEERFTSPTMRGGDPPADVSVDLTGARRLSLVVDFADRGDELDRAQWLDARLVE